jgi:hypothetical protein
MAIWAYLEPKLFSGLSLKTSSQKYYKLSTLNLVYLVVAGCSLNVVVDDVP